MMPIQGRGSIPGCLVLGLLLSAPLGVSALHSVFPYDMATFVELEGLITGVRWRSPHIMLKIAAQDDSSESIEWELEGDSINAAMRRGLTRDSINVGDRVRVAGNPSNRGVREMLVTHVLLPNGQEHLVHDRPRPLRWTEAPTDAPPVDSSLGRSIFRVWSFGSSHRPREPYVYTPSAQAARAAFEPATDMLALRCIAPGMPNAILNPYPIEFIDEGEQIRLRVEQWDATRLIDMASAEVPDGTAPSLLGYSLGDWEGDTLVVKTSHVDFPYLDDEGTPLSEEAEMVERFTVSDDGRRLHHEVVITDPRNLVEPVIVDGFWNWIPGAEIGPYGCESEQLAPMKRGPMAALPKAAVRSSLFGENRTVALGRKRSLEE